MKNAKIYTTMMMILVALVMASALTIQSEGFGPKAPPIAKTECGSVMGQMSADMTTQSYRGIPYGTSKRFQSAESLKAAGKCWTGVFNATEFGLSCYNLPAYGLPIPPASEDCLSVAVYTTASPGKNAPVMIFFHGGDLTAGSATMFDFTEAARMMKKEQGDIVLVVAQYRLNAFGFLSTDDLVGLDPSRPSSVTGMLGIKDQQEALRWVQRNIANFGGDPKRVLAFGQSSGGTSIIALMASKASKGLFSAAMSLSGSPNISMTPDIQRRQHEYITKAMGCTQSTKEERLKCLLTTNATDIVKAIPNMDSYAAPAGDPSWSVSSSFELPNVTGGLRLPGLAVVDGEVLETAPIETFAAGDGVDVPFVVSVMAQEINLLPTDPDMNKMSATDFEKYITSTFANMGKGLAGKIVEQYKDTIAESPLKAYGTIGTDPMMACSSIKLSEAAAKGNSKPVYMLMNEAHIYNTTSLNIGFPWPWVPDNQLWSFHTLDLSAAMFNDFNISKRLRKSWYEFASTGKISEYKAINPDKIGNGEGVTVNRFLNDNVIIAPGWKQDVCQFWSEAGLGGEEFWWSD